jgi:hypothetical protein
MSGRRWTLALSGSAILSCLLSACGSQVSHTPKQKPPAGSGAVAFTDMRAGSGVDFPLHHDLSTDLGIKQTNGHPLALLDADGDGLLDLLAAGPDRVTLYHNLGDWKFSPVTNGGFRQAGFWQGVAVGDVDADGRPDVYLSGFGCAALYLNQGGGRFREVTASSGLECRDPQLWQTSAAFTDVDHDGLLDLYTTCYVDLGTSDGVCLYPGKVRTACGPSDLPLQRGRLYRNQGKGRFTDATAAFGLNSASGKGLGVTFGDVDEDGFPELYLANDKMACNLFRNRRGRGFTDIGLPSGTAFNADGLPQAGMGVDFGDYDNDGREDLVVTTFQREPTSLYHNDGETVFTNVAYASHLGAATSNTVGYGVKWADFDNDGLLDLAIANGHPLHRIRMIDASTDYPQPFQLFRNQGGGVFSELTQVGTDLPRPLAGRALATGDLDNDGRIDLVISDLEGQPLLLRNGSSAQNHWLRVRLQGPLTEGALVKVRAGGRSWLRRSRSGGSYLSASDARVHFGLGSATSIDGLEVRWPDGRVTKLGPLPPDREVAVSATATVQSSSQR